MTPEQALIEASEAKQLLENKHFKAAFEAVNGYLDDVAMSCDPDNKDKAQRIVISKQLLAAVKREIERKLDEGYIAEVQMAELERKKSIFKFYR